MSSESMLATQWWEEYRSAVRTNGTHRAEVFIRSHAPTLGGHDYRKRVFQALDSAVADQSLDRYDVTIIGDGFCLCESCVERPPGRQFVEKFSALWEWNEETVEPVGFEERMIESSVASEHHRILSPPELCLIVSVDDAVEGVFPCRIGDTHFGVEEFLGALTAAPTEPSPSRVDV